jgi:integrase
VDRPTVKYSGSFQTLTPVEVLALHHAAKDQQNGVIYLMAAFTGLRLGELVALRWSDVAFGLQRVQVQRNRPSNSRSEGEKAPKSGKVRSAPLVDEVVAALDGLSQRAKWTGPNDLVFVNDAGDPVSGWTLRRHFYQDLERAGLGHLREKREGHKPIVFHDLRHAFGTLGAQVWELPKLQAYMGHGAISTTMRYVHHSPATRDVGLLGDAIRAASGPVEASISVPGRYPQGQMETPENDESPANAGLSVEAPTGIEPVYTALQAAERAAVCGSRAKETPDG